MCAWSQDDANCSLERRRAVDVVWVRSAVGLAGTRAAGWHQRLCPSFLKKWDFRWETVPPSPLVSTSTKGILFWYAVGKKIQLCSGYVGLLSWTAGFPVVLELLKYSVAVTKCDFCGLSFCEFHLAGCRLFIKLQAAPCAASGCTTTFSANRIPCASQLLPSLMWVQSVSWLSENRSQLASPHGWAKLPLAPSGVVLPSVSGARIRRQGGGGSSTARGNETAGNLPCSAARKDGSWGTGGCGWGLKGVGSWRGVVSGWMKTTARSYLYPRWYMPSTEITAVMGLMIDLVGFASRELVLLHLLQVLASNLMMCWNKIM